MHNNPLVDFLAAYGPTAYSNNIYDEFVSKQANKTGCKPLEIKQKLIGKLYKLLTSEKPRSVILTGTAGDGKTYLARKILEKIDPEENWGNTSKSLEIIIPSNGRKITFIKDLSELSLTEKKEMFSDVYNSLRNDSPDLYLICVNDGHLLHFFRELEEDRVIHSKITYMLQHHKRKDVHRRFDLINMSWRSNENTLKEIFREISNHPGWEDCTGCPALNSENNPCPIRLNLEVIREDSQNSMQLRLQEMINLAAYDGNHLSIRQLLLLGVNIILGDQKNANVTNKELLDCRSARSRAKKNEYKFTNPYSNVFGSNLNSQARNNFKVFSIMSEFGVGYETNNFFDHGLMNKKETFFPTAFYGSNIFEENLRDYIEDPNQFNKKFRQAIVAQRQRLFFTLIRKETNYKPLSDHWNLTRFKWGEKYLNLTNLEEREFTRIKSKLFMSLNRMMTGQLTHTSDEVWLVATTGIYAGFDGSVLLERLGKNNPGRIFLDFVKSTGYGKSPILRVKSNMDNSTNVDFKITPTFFEYLMRIAEGSLPASFPYDFQQAVRRFQIKVVALKKEISGGRPLSSQVELVGERLQEKQIRILE